ncbi:MAG: MBL fold metallo-hydrolase [Verrucomicrobia bacterium]|nr:MBL fold metallo-hydrolase [Verrucomicrobiota bacterium]
MKRSRSNPARTPSENALQVRFWGVRGSIPTPGRSTLRHGGNTSCVEVRWRKTLIALDAGTGIRMLGSRLGEEFRGRAIDLTLLLTHTHWDHIQGFPFFRPAYKAKNRITVLGGHGTKRGIRDLLNDQMESPFFPVGLRDLPSSISIRPLPPSPFFIGEIRVEAIRVNHPGFCVGYRLFTPERSIAYFPDNELAKRLPPQTPVRLTDERLREFIRGVDLLIMDTQYDRSSYADHAGWGHGCLDDVVRLATAAEARRLCLFHHDPEHDDAKIDLMLKHARDLTRRLGSGMRVSAAKEGAVLAFS